MPYLTAEVTHCAPELIKTHLESKIDGAPLPDSVEGDVYSLACVIYQIVHRLPLIEALNESGESFLFGHIKIVFFRVHARGVEWHRHTDT